MNSDSVFVGSNLNLHCVPFSTRLADFYIARLALLSLCFFDHILCLYMYVVPAAAKTPIAGNAFTFSGFFIALQCTCNAENK